MQHGVDSNDLYLFGKVSNTDYILEVYEKIPVVGFMFRTYSYETTAQTTWPVSLLRLIFLKVPWLGGQPGWDLWVFVYLLPLKQHPRQLGYRTPKLVNCWCPLDCNRSLFWSGAFSPKIPFIEFSKLGRFLVQWNGKLAVVAISSNLMKCAENSE